MCIPTIENRNKGFQTMGDKRLGYSTVMYSANSDNIIHPKNGIKYPGLFDKKISQTSESFPGWFPKKGVTWPGALRTKNNTASIPKNVSVFSNKNGSGYAARYNKPVTAADLGRTPDVPGSNPGSKMEEEVKLIWEARSVNQTNPTPQLQNLSGEEIIPGERALMDIVRSTIKPN